MMRVAASSALSRIMAATARPSDVGHAGVQQHQRVRPAVGGAVPQGVHGRHPVTHRRGLHLPAAQPLRQDVPVGGIVIDHQHGQVVERDRRLSRDRLRGVRLPAEAAP